MSLLKGTLTAARFLALGPAPNEADLNEGLSQARFRPFEDGLDEERVGWCDWRNGLYIPPDPDWVAIDQYRLFGLRVDSRKVPPALLAAHVELRIARIIAEKDIQALGKEARLSIQDEVKAEMLKKIMPTMKVHDVVWDLKGGEVLFSASSSKAQTALAKLFMKSFGVELVPMMPLHLAGKLAPEIPTEALMALDPLDFTVEGS
jgi:DNA recombination-dependent growth factor C